MPFCAKAQNVTIGTNALQYVNLGTLNIEAGVSVSQHISLFAGGRYNGWQFEKSDPMRMIQNQQQTFYGGMRYWPWYNFSGLWFGTKAQYSKINESGIWRPALESATKVGAGISFGYTLMLSERLNLDFGIGGWAGKALDYNLYCCPYCMDLRDTGPRWFCSPDEISISLVWVL